MKTENKPKKSKERKVNKIVEKKPYNKFKFIHYGDIRDLTLAPSPGIFESGAPGAFKGS